MYKKPEHYNYFERHKLYRDYRDFVLKDEYVKPVMYTVGVYELDDMFEEHLTEMMALPCDNLDWAVVEGVVYRKKGTHPIGCIRRVAMSVDEIIREGPGRKPTHFYKILKEKEFNSYAELREALEQEEGEEA